MVEDRNLYGIAAIGAAIALSATADADPGDGNGGGENGDSGPDDGTGGDPPSERQVGNPPSGATTGGSIPTTGSTASNTFLWVQSTTGSEVGFEFETDGSGIQTDVDASGSGYWVDGTTAGGRTSGTSNPGFFFDGEITAFEYVGTPDVYLNSTPVDPGGVTEWFETPSGGGTPGTDMPEAPGPVSGWNVAASDHFEGGSLDTSIWSNGFGWGTNANYTHGTAEADSVSVHDSVLQFTPTCYGWQNYGFGAVNTRNKLTIEPPVFVEASIRAGDMPGMNNAFWTKPNNENWPPEIDILEIPTNWGNMRRSIHHIHYSEEMHCNSSSDSGTKRQTGNGPHDYAQSQALDFHRHGILWEPDSITHYVDGQAIGTTSGGAATGHQDACGPHYVMLNCLVSHNSWSDVGMPPSCGDWSNHKSTMEVDWFRVLEP